MRIALINENSQAAKNDMIYSTLKKVADSKGFEVDNYGMYSADDKAQLHMYRMVSLLLSFLTAVLLILL